MIENDELNDHIERLRQRGVTVLLGDASDPQLLRRARAGRARRVLAVCGDDAINAEVALRCRELSRESGGSALDCYVHIVDGDLCRLLKEQELRGSGEDLLRLEFFNVFESGARRCSSASTRRSRLRPPRPRARRHTCSSWGAGTWAATSWRAALGSGGARIWGGSVA